MVDAAAEGLKGASVAAGSFGEEKETMAVVEGGEHGGEGVVRAIDDGAVDEDGVKDSEGEEAAEGVDGPVVGGGDGMGGSGESRAEDGEVEVAGVV